VEITTADCSKRVVPGICFYNYCDNYYFSFRTRTVQKLKMWVCTARAVLVQKLKIIIVTINVKVNSEDDTFSAIGGKDEIVQLFSTVTFCHGSRDVKTFGRTWDVKDTSQCRSSGRRWDRRFTSRPVKDMRMSRNNSLPLDERLPIQG
jgi:hypothetical protein